MFGWTFLDWAEDELGDEDRAHLARVAAETIDALTESWEGIRGRPTASVDDLNTLGWMETEAYMALARRSLETRVLAPLRARGIDPVCERSLD